MRTPSFVLVVCLLGSAVAHADKKVAGQHYKNGITLYGEGKHREAIAEFQRAYELAPHPVVLYNLGVAYRANSEYGKALATLERFVKDGAGVVSKKELRRGQEELKTLKELVARLTVKTTPENAELFLDGTAVAEQPIVVGPGSYSLRASYEGYQDAIKKVTLASKDELELTLELVKKPVAPPVVVGAVGASASTEAPHRPWLGLTAGFGTNALQIADTGAPVVGLSFTTRRLTLAVDTVLAAYAVLPSVRWRLFGDVVALDATLAVPIAFKDGDDSETFVAGAGGLAVRYRATDHLAVRVDGMVSYAGSDRGVTVPVIAATEYWF